MVSSISSTPTYFQKTDFNKSLTDDQKDTLAGILSKYDSKTATNDQIKSMMDEIRQSGIPPTKSTMEIIKNAGFKLPEKPGGVSPDGTDSVKSDTASSALIDAFLSKQKTGTLTNDDVNTLLQNLINSGSLTTGSVVDEKV